MANLMMSRYGLIVSANPDKTEVSVDVINGVAPEDMELDLIICRIALSAIAEHTNELLNWYLDDDSIPEEDKLEWQAYKALFDANGL